MSVVDHLVETKTALELAKMVYLLTVDNCALRDKVHELKHQIFWMQHQPANKEE